MTRHPNPEVVVCNMSGRLAILLSILSVLAGLLPLEAKILALL